MRRPSFQFYPSDWRGNANLRRCSWAARGAWVEVMGLFHDSDEYGLLRWTLEEIAQALGCPIELLQELAKKGVMKGSDSGAVPQLIYTPKSGRQEGPPVVLVPAQTGPLWYSSRMVRDEHIRQERGGSTRYTPGEASPKPPIGEGIGADTKGGISDGASSSSSSASKPPHSPPLEKTPAVTLRGWLGAIGKKQAIPDDHPVFAYAQRVGLSEDFLRLQWVEFVGRYSERDKRYRDWPKVFYNSVRGNWFHLWTTDAQTGQFKLTTVGKQAAADAAARAAAKRKAT